MLKDNLLDFFGGVAAMQIVGHFVELGHLIVPRLQLTIVALLIFHPKFVLRYIISYDDDFLYLTAVFQDRDALRFHVANTFVSQDQAELGAIALARSDGTIEYLSYLRAILMMDVFERKGTAKCFRIAKQVVKRGIVVKALATGIHYGNEVLDIIGNEAKPRLVLRFLISRTIPALDL